MFKKGGRSFMADKIKAIKIKQKNGTYTGEIPISVNVQNV